MEESTGSDMSSSSDTMGTSHLGGHISSSVGSTTGSSSSNSSSDSKDSSGDSYSYREGDSNKENRAPNGSSEESESEIEILEKYEKSLRRKVNSYMRRHRCSRQKAKRKVRRNEKLRICKKLRSKWGVTGGLFDPQAPVATPPQRMDRLDVIFGVMYDGSDNWRELRATLIRASGEKNEVKIFNNLLNKAWPKFGLMLFVEYVLDYEFDKKIWENRNLSEKELDELCARLMRDHKRLRRIINEDVILLQDEDPVKKYLCDVFFKFMESKDDNDLLSYYLVDKSRRFLYGKNSSVISVNNKNVDSDAVKGARAIVSGLCYWYNFFTCHRGGMCPHKHICARACKDAKRHGLRYCPKYKEESINFKKFGSGYKRTYPGAGRGTGGGRGNYGNNNNNNNNRNSGGGHHGGGFGPPPTQMPRMGNGSFSYSNWNLNGNSNPNGNSNNSNNNNGGMLAAVPGMQYTMVPMLTPINDNSNKNKKKKNS